MREEVQDEKAEKYQDLGREVHVQNVDCEDKGCSSGSRTIGINTTEIEQPPTNPWGGHSCWNDPEMCIVGVKERDFI